MALDRQQLGVTVLRTALGLFFVFEALGKWRWFLSSGPLQVQLVGWAAAVRPGSLSDWYLHHVALAAVPLFARLVPLGELAVGVALVAGLETGIAAAVAFALVLNFHVASGLLFRSAFLTSGYGLPVLGGTLALAIGGRTRK
jgi:uncharacterized membrane protein YphA (DoxX/SURF4 family)